VCCCACNRCRPLVVCQAVCSACHSCVIFAEGIKMLSSSGHTFEGVLNLQAKFVLLPLPLQHSGRDRLTVSLTLYAKALQQNRPCIAGAVLHIPSHTVLTVTRTLQLAFVHHGTGVPIPCEPREAGTHNLCSCVQLTGGICVAPAVVGVTNVVTRK